MGRVIDYTKPAKCESCRTPIWRWLAGQLVCLNCPLHDAIHLNRDDMERVRLLKLIDETKPRREQQWQADAN